MKYRFCVLAVSAEFLYTRPSRARESGDSDKIWNGTQHEDKLGQPETKTKPVVAEWVTHASENGAYGGVLALEQERTVHSELGTA